MVLDYAEHDYCVAAISHLPHLVAAGLVNLVKDSDSPSETMKLLAAGGFKDNIAVEFVYRRDRSHVYIGEGIAVSPA